MITTVVEGLEMFAFNRNPGSARCDGCGDILYSNRYDLKHDLKRHDWTYNKFRIGEPCWCPQCNGEE